VFRTIHRDAFEALAAAKRAKVRAAVVIPTNRECRMDGTAVMGAGLAEAAVRRSPGLEARYGLQLRNGMRVTRDNDFIMFPTKNRWRERASISLIKDSCRRLVELVSATDIEYVLVPPVGCGLGGLDWDGEVRPLLERELAPIADRVIFVLRKRDAANAGARAK
jgi:hypothetical protein